MVVDSAVLQCAARQNGSCDALDVGSDRCSDSFGGGDDVVEHSPFQTTNHTIDLTNESRE